jgi:transposase
LKDYDHYIGLEWAQQNMAIARMTRVAQDVHTMDVRSDLDELKLYLGRLKGTKILTFEESCPAQWLFTELKECVDEIVVCDPHRNHLLSEGAKSDRVDARKLAELLRAGLLKPVFHCTDKFIKMRKIISAYDDVKRIGVAQKNQRSALFRSCGKRDSEQLDDLADKFVLAGLDSGIDFYEKQRTRYKSELERFAKEHDLIRNLQSIPGLGVVGSVTIAAIVVDAARFKKKQHFWSYCGLIRHDLMSGGRSYGKRSPRCSRRLKSVFKTAAVTCIVNQKDSNPLYVYYQHLIHEKRYPEFQARHALAMRIATLAFGVLKSNRKLNVKELFGKNLN